MAEGLVKAFKANHNIENQMILWVKAAETREVIANELTGMGAIVDEAIAYQTVAEKEYNLEALARLKNEGADMITFTSSSTVEHFRDLGVALPEGCEIASIGPVTSQTLTKHQMPIAVEAKSFTIPGLVEAIRKHFAK